MKPETIKKLIDKGITSDKLVEILTKDTKINQNRQCYEQSIEIETNNYQQKIKELNQKIHQLQQECPHYETDYIPDASGNNGSYYICTTCKHESKRQPLYKIS